MQLSSYNVQDKLNMYNHNLDKFTTITLSKYLFDMSTTTTPRKDIFLKHVENSNSHQVIVKITYGNNIHYHLFKTDYCGSNIYLPMDAMEHNDGVDITNDWIEISMLGKVLIVSSQRSSIEKIHIMTQLLLEMDKIHKFNIIHNDVKPSNIITIINPLINRQLMQQSEQETKPTFLCKFIDFEISKCFSSQDDDFSYCFKTKISSTSGTPGYMPPEKLDNDENNFIHTKTDIYCLGLVFSEVIFEKRMISLKESSQKFWKELKEECLKQFNEKGEVIFTMIEKMLQYKISQRWTARQCLTHMNITEKVDETDFNSYFYPEPIEATTESNVRKDL